MYIKRVFTCRSQLTQQLFLNDTATLPTALPSQFSSNSHASCSSRGQKSALHCAWLSEQLAIKSSVRFRDVLVVAKDVH